MGEPSFNIHLQCKRDFCSIFDIQTLFTLRVVVLSCQFNPTYTLACNDGAQVHKLLFPDEINGNSHSISEAVYLDHTGATLYAKSQLQSYHDSLLKNMYGNPHSSSLSSENTSGMIQDVRQEILSFFNTTSDEYHVIFTCNATHGIKLVAENFKFQNANDSTESASWFAYLQDNHTSVVGIRAAALEKGVNVRVIDYKESSGKTLSAILQHETSILGNREMILNGGVTKNPPSENVPNNLFAFPAMSNFSGHKYPLEWVSIAQKGSLFSNDPSGRWLVLLDAASFVSTSALDLCSYHPDFVPVSFYKLFGFPTGLGALLVSVKGAEALSKIYFGGGSVSAYSSDTDFHVLKASLQDRLVLSDFKYEYIKMLYVEMV